MQGSGQSKGAGGGSLVKERLTSWAWETSEQPPQLMSKLWRLPLCTHTPSAVGSRGTRHLGSNPDQLCDLERVIKLH